MINVELFTKFQANHVVHIHYPTDNQGNRSPYAIFCETMLECRNCCIFNADTNESCYLEDESLTAVELKYPEYFI